MIIGKSKIKKAVYVDVSDETAYAMGNKGYEVIELGDRPILLVLKSDYGMCSGPSIFSARHCFGEPLHDVVGKRYVLVGSDAEGRVTKDYSPSLYNLFVRIVTFFVPFSRGVKDVVKVSVPLYDVSRQIAVVAGGVPGRGVGLFAPVPTVDPEDYVGADVLAVVDMPEADEIRCKITDYAVIDILVGKIPWPFEVFVSSCRKPLRPGNSGGPVYLYDGSDEAPSRIS